MPKNAAPGRHSLAALISIAALLAGCDEPKSPDPDSGTAPGVTAPADDARTAAGKLAVAAYRGMWTAYAKAGLTANADEPDLERYASGQALKTLKDGLTSLRQKGQVLKGEYGSNPRADTTSPASSPSSITVVDCLNSENFLTYKANGERVDDEPGGRRSTQATVERGSDGTWKVTSFGVQAVGTC